MQTLQCTESLFFIHFTHDHIKKTGLKSRILQGSWRKNTASTAQNCPNNEIHVWNLAHQPSVYLYCRAERLEYIKGWQALIIFLLSVWNKLHTTRGEFLIEGAFLFSYSSFYNFMIHTKGQTNSKWFFQADVSSKNERTKSTLLLVDLFSFVFRKKMETPKLFRSL